VPPDATRSESKVIARIDDGPPVFDELRDAHLGKRPKRRRRKKGSGSREDVESFRDNADLSTRAATTGSSRGVVSESKASDVAAADDARVSSSLASAEGVVQTPITKDAKDGAGVNANKQTSESNKRAFLNKTVYDGTETGKGGARGGYSKIFRGSSEKGRYVKTIFSRALERTGITGASALASFSLFGSIVGVGQASSYFAMRAIRKDMSELDRQGRIARKAYRSMTRNDVYEHALNLADVIKGKEELQTGVEAFRDFLPLAAIVATNMKSIQKIPTATGRAAATFGVSLLMAGGAGYIGSEMASTPQSMRYAVTTVADHMTPDMIRGGVATVTSGEGLKVSLYANDNDMKYSAMVASIYEGASSVNTIRDEKIQAMAFTRGISSPFDVIRSNAKTTGTAKIGVGAIVSSERAALDAQSESSDAAESMLYKRFFRDLAHRSAEQRDNESKRFNS
jgi:hypothetical protein